MPLAIREVLQCLLQQNTHSSQCRHPRDSRLKQCFSDPARITRLPSNWRNSRIFFVILDSLFSSFFCFCFTETLHNTFLINKVALITMSLNSINIILPTKYIYQPSNTTAPFTSSGPAFYMERVMCMRAMEISHVKAAPIRRKLTNQNYPHDISQRLYKRSGPGMADYS